MADSQHNAELNTLVIDLGRSLLQYVGEAWPWTDAASRAMQADVDELVALQTAMVQRIADLLAERNWPIDFGVYPVEYTDLHYVSLDFLLGQLIRNADELVAELREIRRRITNDPQASTLLDELEREQQFIVNKLRELAEPPQHADEEAAA